MRSIDRERPPERVAVVLMSAIGSTVQGMPIVASLRRAWPESHIAWVLQPAAASLMEGSPNVDEIILFRRERGVGAYPDFRRRVRDRRFDLVLCLQPVFKGGAVTRMIPALVRLGYDRARARDLSWLATNRRVPPRPVGHVQDELFEFLPVLGIEGVREWDFHFTAEERQAHGAWRDARPGRLLGIVTRSSLRAKDWTLEGYARVIDEARDRLGLTPILLGGEGPGEREDAERLGRMCAVPPLSDLGGSLRQLAGRLDACDVVLSPDTGPLHMSVALGTPTVGLYGYTDPKRHGPYGRFSELTVDRFSKPGETAATRETRRGNMVRIGADEVLDKLDQAMRKYGERGT